MGLGRISVAALLLLAACTVGTDPETGVAPGPSQHWERASPDVAGFDAEALEKLDAALRQQGSACVAVVKDGKLVHHRDWGRPTGTPVQAYSVTKSVTAILVGIAQDEGWLSIDEPASHFVAEWRGTASAEVTIRDILANVSGRQWDATTDYSGMVAQAGDKTAFAVALKQASPPGTVWNYNNSAIQVLSRILREATGREPADYAQEKLFEPLGMTHTEWFADAAGHTMTFSGLASTCTDLAKIGQLMLNGGRWGDTQVVPREFVAESTGKPSSTLNAGYGLLWWVNAAGAHHGVDIASGGGAADPSAPRLAPGLPTDAFWAIGLGQQIIAVVPSEGVVAVRLGARPASSAVLNSRTFTQAVLGAEVER